MRRLGPNVAAAVALAWLATLPESPERVQRELTLQLALGEWLRSTMGLGAQDVGQVYTRAYTLCQQVTETPHLPLVLWGLSQFHMTRGRLALAGEKAGAEVRLRHIEEIAPPAAIDGSPYGVSHVTGPENDAPLEDAALHALDHLVERALTVAGKLAG